MADLEQFLNGFVARAALDPRVEAEMAVQYTDVDLMLLKGWEEVSALREAFPQLAGNIGPIIQGA